MKRLIAAAVLLALIGALLFGNYAVTDRVCRRMTNEVSKIREYYEADRKSDAALKAEAAEKYCNLLAVSLALTLLMLHTGHIAVPVTAHLVYNMTAMGWGSVPLWVSAICGAGLIGLFVRIRTAWPETVQPTMRKADGLIAAAAVAVLILSYMI